MCDQVLLSEIYTDPGGARVVVKELKANASAKEQNDFLQQGDPYRWTPTPEPLKFFLAFYFKTSVWTEISIWHQCNVSSTLYLSSHTSKILFAVLINIFLNMFYVLLSTQSVAAPKYPPMPGPVCRGHSLPACLWVLWNGEWPHALLNVISRHKYTFQCIQVC